MAKAKRKSTGDLGKIIERLDRIDLRITVQNQGLPKGLRLKIRELMTKEKFDLGPLRQGEWEFTCGCCANRPPPCPVCGRSIGA